VGGQRARVLLEYLAECGRRLVLLRLGQGHLTKQVVRQDKVRIVGDRASRERRERA
jgi:hypothetical protein